MSNSERTSSNQQTDSNQNINNNQKTNALNNFFKNAFNFLTGGNNAKTNK